jgi:hypothetical protein
MPGYPLCGSVTDVYECLAAETVSVCGGESSLTRGDEDVVATIGECHVECIPGTREPCTTATGAPGTRVVCGNDCRPIEGAECVGSTSGCPAGEVQEVACGCGAVRVRTCGAGGSWGSWDASACPACFAGATRDVSCGGSGTCGGTRSDTCSAECVWVEGVCEAEPQVCTPGSTQTNVGSCGGACGVTYTETRTCLSSGCGWSAWTSDEGEVCASVCMPGETRPTDRNCNPAIPGCPNIQQLCNAACTWVDLPCGGDCG